MMATPFHDFIDFVTCVDQQSTYQKTYEKLQHKKQLIEQKMQNDLAEFARAEEQVRSLQKQLDGYELELGVLRKKGFEIDAKMERIANPREYTSLQHEKEENGLKAVQIEDAIVKLWDVIGIAQLNLADVRKAFSQKKIDYDKELHELANILELGANELTSIIRMCSIKREQVRPDWLERFDVLKKQIANPVVELKSGICSGCFNKVPAHIENRVERRELCTCPMCGRILYSLLAL